MRPAGTDTLAGGAVVHTSLVARLLGLRLLTVEGTVVLSPVSFGITPPHTAARAAPAPALNFVPKQIGARLAPTARLIDESINDLRSLGH